MVEQLLCELRVLVFQASVWGEPRLLWAHVCGGHMFVVGWVGGGLVG